jgi:hypothetical protein
MTNRGTAHSVCFCIVQGSEAGGVDSLGWRTLFVLGFCIVCTIYLEYTFCMPRVSCIGSGGIFLAITSLLLFEMG